MIDHTTSIDGCFETMLFHKGHIKLAEEHFDRLHRSLAYLEWTLPVGLSVPMIENEVVDAINLQGFSLNDYFRCRLTLFREIGSHVTEWRLDVYQQIHPSQSFMLKNVHFNDPVFEGFARRCKLATRNPYQEAFKFATKQGFDDALLTIDDGYLSETTIANIIWLKGDEFNTPDTSSGQLYGLGLSFFLSVLNSHGINVKTGKYKLDSLLKADTSWIINSVRGPIPIKQIDEFRLSINQSATNKVYDLYWRNLP